MPVLLSPRVHRPGADPSPTARPTVLNIAHRGASAEAPENTLAAIRAALARGAHLVEVDVQRTRDGALVLLHDATLERTTDVARVFPRRAPWRLADFTYDEVRRLDAGAWKAPCFAGERVPLLTDALEAMRAGGVGALVELKVAGSPAGLARDVAGALRVSPTLVAGEHRRDPDRVIVQSFDESVVRELKWRLPAVPVGLLGTPARSRLAGLSAWADLVNPPHQRADRTYVEAVQQSGMRCLVWTVDGSWSMRRSLRAGVDGIITNHPERLHRLLGGFRRDPDSSAVSPLRVGSLSRTNRG